MHIARFASIRRFIPVSMALALLTSASAVSAAPWRFAVLCDTRGDGPHATPLYPDVNEPVVRAIANAMVNDGVKLVLAPGDLIHGQPSSAEIVHAPLSSGDDEFGVQLAVWTNAMAAVYEAGIPVYPVRGNHENYHQSGPASHVAWSNIFAAYVPMNGPAGEASMTYSFTYSNAFFAGVDQYGGILDDANYHALDQTWLDQQLAANTQPHVFVFGHEPAFRAGISCLSEIPASRDTFWNSLANAGAAVYFTGHSHVYGRALAACNNSASLRQIIIGTCGGPLDHWQGDYEEGSATGTSLNVNSVLLRGEMALAPPLAPEMYGYMLVEVDGLHVIINYMASTNATDASPIWVVMDTWAYDQTAMTPPANLTATQGTMTDRVTVAWTASAGASSYEVWRNTGPEFSNATMIASNVVQANYSDTTVVLGLTYDYWVRAVYTAGATPFNGPVTGWLEALPGVGPDIRINSASGTVMVNRGDGVSLAVRMDPGSYIGTPADWWLVALAVSDWYYYNSLYQWIGPVDISAIHPAYQGPLFILPETEVLRTSDLGAGSYSFYFGVSPMSGNLNPEQAWYKTVNLHVQ